MELALDGNMEGMTGKRIRGKRPSPTLGVSVGAIARALLSSALLYRKLTRAKRMLSASKMTPRKRGSRGAMRPGMGGKMAKAGRCPYRRGGAARSLGALSVGATALGAFAVGAFAVGALAIRALAIRRLAIKRGGVEELDIRRLKVGRLEVEELLVREETHSQPPTPPSGGPLPG